MGATEAEVVAVLTRIASRCTPAARTGSRPDPECVDDYCRALLLGVTYTTIAEHAVVSEPAIVACVRRAADKGNPLAMEAREATAARRGGPGRRSLTG